MAALLHSPVPQRPPCMSIAQQHMYLEARVDKHKSKLAGGMMPNKTEKSHIDVNKRLEQWKLEATDPQHPNYHDADLGHPARLHAVISSLLSELQNSPESFDQEDALSLFGELNSGRRTKNRLVAQNPLPELRTALLTMLYGDGAPAARSQTAGQAIRLAGPSMLGELYGWAHIRYGPALQRLRHRGTGPLGLRVRPGDYDAFVAAHEQFKQVYQQQVGRICTPTCPSIWRLTSSTM